MSPPCVDLAFDKLKIACT